MEEKKIMNAEGIGFCTGVPGGLGKPLGEWP